MRAPLLYGGALAHAIARLKYHGATHLARPLAQLMRPELAGLAGQIDLIVPVPLHRRRLVARGFNQAALLARYACRGLGIKVAHDLLQRVRDTPPQTRLRPGERWANVRRAFRASGAAPDRRLLLIDDVATTGATATACATALLEAGASAVHLLTLARAVP